MRDVHCRMITGIAIWVFVFSSVGIAASSRIPGPDPDDRATPGPAPVSETQAGNPGSELRTGLALLRAERWSAAQSHLRSAAGADANVRKQLASLGEEAFSGARFKEALTLINSVVDLVPDAAPLHSMAGACYYNLQNPALAVKEVQQAIRLKPENEDYYIQLAQVLSTTTRRNRQSCFWNRRSGGSRPRPGSALFWA
jgi:tetratricopeptide (TPR) repeat protein